MPRTSRQQLVQSQLDEGVRQAARYVDLQLDFVRYKSGTPIARFGGEWDRREKRYTGDAARSFVIEAHAEQVSAVQAFDEWFAEHLHGAPASDRIRDILADGDVEISELDIELGLCELILSGGRRSGKTTIAEALGIGYSVGVDGAIVWTVVPSEQMHEEPREVIAALMPDAWYTYLGWPHFTFHLANGSDHILRSGHSPGNLKKGKADVVIVNEAQQVKLASYNNARGAVVDSGGVVITAANPPVPGDVGVWVRDAVIQTEKKARPGASHVFIDPLLNPRIDPRRLLALRTSMTLYDWETQIRGKMLAFPGTIFYAWDEKENERPTPNFGNITREFLREHEGPDYELDHILIVDVQKFPFIAALVVHAFRDPSAPNDARRALLWGTEEIAMAQGDEVDLCNEFTARGFDPARTMAVMDASCHWQQQQRDPEKQRPKYKGAASASILRDHGFGLVVRPDRKQADNPGIMEGVRAANLVIRAVAGDPELANGIRGLYLDPKTCPNAIASVQGWKLNKHGHPEKSRAAHFGDDLRYLAWRFYPRRGGIGSLVTEVVKRPRPEGFAELTR